MFGGDLWCGINGDTDELQIATSAHVSLSTYRSHVKYKAHSATRCFQSQEANSLLSVKIMFQDSKDKLVLGTVDFKAKRMDHPMPSKKNGRLQVLVQTVSCRYRSASSEKSRSPPTG